MTTVPDYTIVIGVDAKHLLQLSWTLPTWRRHKPSLFDHPIVIFYDREDEAVNGRLIREVVDHPDLTVYPWPPKGVVLKDADADKWTNSQRYKMLAGYVHVPAAHVWTPYWLKLDTDAIAMGQDNWINPEWFKNDTAFIGPKWNFTRPPDQMMVLDKWVERNKHCVDMIFWSNKSPLNLVPQPDSDRLGHRRACSWCAFFNTEFTRKCAIAAASTCGECQLPVPSQDGFLWYMATRGGYGVKPENIKAKGWAVRASLRGIASMVHEVMNEGRR